MLRSSDLKKFRNEFYILIYLFRFLLYFVEKRFTETLQSGAWKINKQFNYYYRRWFVVVVGELLKVIETMFKYLMTLKGILKAFSISDCKELDFQHPQCNIKLQT